MLGISHTTWILLAGAGQLALAAGSLAIPLVLGWREELRKLRPLTRQVFWVYAAYILGTNVALGALSVAAPHALLDRTTLARAVAAYAAAYWGARLVLQLLVLDRSDTPQGAWIRAADGALTLLFAFLTAVYGAAALA